MIDSRGSDAKIVKLRNPWNKFESNRDWSDNSALWTEDLKDKLNVKEEDDGTFWMNIEDF